jgi:hydroxyacid-oxoacid transhydrogenase
MNLLRTIQYTHPPSCPCHGNPGHLHNPPTNLLSHAKKSLQRNYATPVDLSRQKEYAFEMSASSIRFGPGVTKEVGMDFKNIGAKKVCVVTDTTVRGLDAMRQAEEGLTREGIEYTVYDGSRVEPKDSSYVFSPSPQGRAFALGLVLIFIIESRKPLPSQNPINQMRSWLSEVDP